MSTPLQSIGHVLALAGGVGGAKLVCGLAAVLRPDQLTVVVNTGDDFEHLGLYVAPDLDSVMYALAGLNDEARGWGVRGESWSCMEALGQLGAETWFALGDRDLATHLERSRRLRAGESLSAVTRALCAALGIAHRLVPMADAPVRTVVQSDEGPLPFQRYFVERRCEPRVHGFTFEGATTATPSSGLTQALARADLEAVVICPSNPFISIDPILALPGIREALGALTSPIVAVSPIVGGRAIKGPAAKMLEELGLGSTALEIAAHYGGLLDGLMVDSIDAALIDAAGPTPAATALLARPTVMRSAEDRARLATEVLSWGRQLRTPGSSA